MTNNKPFSMVCERNKQPILHFLRQWLLPGEKVLEIGSGTGQHGVFFASQLADVVWQCTDQAEALVGLRQWVSEAHLQNLPEPFALDVNHCMWHKLKYQAVFTANTLHIMSWPTVKNFLQQVNQALAPKGKLILYGPFRYQGAYTSDSNAEFDQYLQRIDPQNAIRDIQEMQIILQDKGFVLIHDQPMPANNQLLLWELAE